jgi:NAD(P)-dependent dehydrogenase (short-subunit alcohol dehydrogenase family)
MSDPDKRTCLVTGATSGLGQALALALARQGWPLALLARDPARGETALAAARQAGASKADLVLADLSDLASVRRAAAEIAGRQPRLHLLVNCASVYRVKREVTPDGLETMFVTNHLGPFLLTHLLLDRLRADGSARILNVTAPSTVRLDFEDLQGARRFRSLQAFGATKMANLLFTFALARRLGGSGVTANAVHPGVLRSGLMRQAPAPMRWMTTLMGTSPARAAEPVVRVATEPSYANQNGKFFHKAEEIAPPAAALDIQAQERLWQDSLRLAGLEA